MFLLMDVQIEIYFEEVDNITEEKSGVYRGRLSLSWQHLSLKKSKKKLVKLLSFKSIKFNCYEGISK